MLFCIWKINFNLKASLAWKTAREISDSHPINPICLSNRECNASFYDALPPTDYHFDLFAPIFLDVADDFKNQFHNFHDLKVKQARIDG